MQQYPRTDGTLYKLEFNHPVLDTQESCIESSNFFLNEKKLSLDTYTFNINKGSPDIGIESSLKLILKIIGKPYHHLVSVIKVFFRILMIKGHFYIGVWVSQR